MKPVFFYGLFMDKVLLKEKGFHPTEPILGYIDGYALRIGERATLTKSTEDRAYGAIMSLSEQELDSLYGEASVADYIPESMVANSLYNETIDVIAYNLPAEKVTGQNKQYAQALAKVASEIGLPAEYIQKIKAFAV